jgi:iron(III) transport system permease protein
VTGGLLVFLTTIKELPATLLLAPIGFDTLATRIWKATEDVYFAEAAAGSLALIGASAALILAVKRRAADGPDPAPGLRPGERNVAQ